MNHIRDAKELLERYNDLKHSLVEMQERYDTLDSRLTSIKSQDYSQLFVESNSNNDTLINMIYEKNTLEKSIAETQQELDRVDSVLEYLEEDGNLLRMMYVHEKPWQQIEMELHISRPQVFRKKKHALNRFAIQLFGLKALVK